MEKVFQDVSALRSDLELLERRIDANTLDLSLLRGAIAGMGSGGGEPFTIEITYDDVANEYNTTVTAEEFWAAWNEGKLIRWHMYSPAYGGYDAYDMWGYPPLIYEYYDDYDGVYHHWAAVIEWMGGNRLYAQNSTDYLTSDNHWNA